MSDERTPPAEVADAAPQGPQRDAKGHFLPGQGGRPKGSHNRKTRAGAKRDRAPAGASVESAVDKLAAGASGSAAVSKIRKTYKTYLAGIASSVGVAARARAAAGNREGAIILAADASTLIDAVEPMGEALAELANVDARARKYLTAGAVAGGYGAVVVVSLGVGLSLASHHGLIPAQLAHLLASVQNGPQEDAGEVDLEELRADLGDIINGGQAGEAGTPEQEAAAL